jgi:hypothetical protein
MPTVAPGSPSSGGGVVQNVHMLDGSGHTPTVSRVGRRSQAFAHETTHPQSCRSPTRNVTRRAAQQPPNQPGAEPPSYTSSR